MVQLKKNVVLQNIKSKYMNSNGADVWFIINDERIPGHKFILSSMCPYYDTMFYGSLPESNEIDLTQSNVSVESFKEFLKFLYFKEPNLTMENISDVISLAKQSLSDDIFTECVGFLQRSVTIDTMFFVYHLALLYDANHLRSICEEEICVNAVKVLQSSSFLEFPYDYLQAILKCDSLACEEIVIFNACIAWAKSACRQNDMDETNAKYLRDQLKDCLYEIRFTSMTKKEAAACIRLCPGLFTADELEEIISMVGHSADIQSKLFNWTSRYFNLKWDRGHQLTCSRFDYSNGNTFYSVGQNEVTRFVCNRRVVLQEVWCEINEHRNMPIQMSIIEGNRNERFHQKLTAQFHCKQANISYDSFIAKIKLNKPILLRPNYTYEIRIKFEQSGTGLSNNSSSQTILKNKVRVDHDTVFQFSDRGIVYGLSLSRFDNKNYFAKVIHNPKMWLLTTVLCLGAGYYCWSNANTSSAARVTSNAVKFCGF